MHIEKTLAKVVGTYIQIYFLFVNEEFVTNMKLALTKALNRSLIILCKINKIEISHVGANPAWEFMANTCLLKMQSMQNTTEPSGSQTPRWGPALDGKPKACTIYPPLTVWAAESRNPRHSWGDISTLVVSIHIQYHIIPKKMY